MEVARDPLSANIALLDPCIAYSGQLRDIVGVWKAVLSTVAPAAVGRISDCVCEDSIDETMVLSMLG